MKLSNVTAKLTSITKSANMKRNALKALAVVTLAGAALAAAPAAQAQRFVVGVRVQHRYFAPAPVVVYGNPYAEPAYVAPEYVAPAPIVSFGYYGHDRFDRGVRYDHQRFDRGFRR